MCTSIPEQKYEARGSICTTQVRNTVHLTTTVPCLMSHKFTFRDSGVDIPIAHLTVADDYSSFELSNYMMQLKSSVEVIGAVLVSDGSCSLDQTWIAMNISTRATLTEGGVLIILLH